MAAVPAIAFMVQMIFYVPHYEKIFMDFKLKLPYLTEVTIAASRWHVKYWYVAVVVLIPALNNRAQLCSCRGGF